MKINQKPSVSVTLGDLKPNVGQTILITFPNQYFCILVKVLDKGWSSIKVENVGYSPNRGKVTCIYTPALTEDSDYSHPEVPAFKFNSTYLCGLTVHDRQVLDLD